MKVVINSCFGGFGLSREAEVLYAKKKGFELFRYEQTKYSHKDGYSEHVKVSSSCGSNFFSSTYTKDLGESFRGYPGDEYYWFSYDIKRDDPDLVAVVEELGEKSSGSCSRLKIVEIPDNVCWKISEYDGNEHIAETHQTWG